MLGLRLRGFPVEFVFLIGLWAAGTAMLSYVGSYFESDRIPLPAIAAVSGVLAIPWTVAGKQSAFTGANITLVVGACIVVRTFMGWRRKRKQLQDSHDTPGQRVPLIVAAALTVIMLIPSAASLSLRGPANTFDLGAYQLLKDDTAWSIAHDIVETGQVQPHYLIDQPFEDRGWRAGENLEDAVFGDTSLTNLHGMVIGICHDGAMDQAEYDSLIEARAVGNEKGWEVASEAKALDAVEQSCPLDAEVVGRVPIEQVIYALEQSISLACSDDLIDRPTAEYDPIYSGFVELNDRLGESATSELMAEIGLPPGCVFSETGMFG